MKSHFLIFLQMITITTNKTCKYFYHTFKPKKMNENLRKKRETTSYALPYSKKLQEMRLIHQKTFHNAF